ncbi:UNVERIFIED_CONTAM: hypothetical protein FKN15_030581 [Acipenser sinensis]
MEQYDINLQEEEERTKAKIKAVNVQKVKLVSELMLLIKDCAKLNMEKVNLSLESTELNAQKSKLEIDCREGSSQLKNMEKQYTELENRKLSLKENCKGLLKKAKDMCNLDPGKNAVPQELQSVVCAEVGLFGAQLTRKRRWELLAWQQAQALTLAPAQLLTPALELTPPAPGVTPDVTELDVSIAEEDHDAISIVVSWKMAASLRSSPYLP